jgi:hypothetical protein
MKTAALGVLLALALAAPATAQQPPADQKPVVGGGSFNAAPILPPGAYHDTVLPAEYIYYAVKVAPGQRLHLTGATDLSRVEVTRDLAVPAVYLTIHSPTRMDVSSTADSQIQEDLNSPGGADFVGPPAKASDDIDTGGPWSGSGIYFLSVNAVWRGSESEPPRAEIPFHFTISLEGAEQPRATATPTPKPTTTPTPTASPGGEGSGGSGAVVAGAGVGGLLIGVIAGIAMRRNRR